jgi:hypothetical protein
MVNPPGFYLSYNVIASEAKSFLRFLTCFGPPFSHILRFYHETFQNSLSHGKEIEPTENFTIANENFSFCHGKKSRLQPFPVGHSVL